MAVNDPIADLITRIRNAGMRKKSKLSSPNSRLRASVLEVLKTEGYIRDYATVEHKDGRNEVEIELKYFEGEPAIREIERVSKPGRRVYVSVKNLPRNAIASGRSRSRNLARPLSTRSERLFSPTPSSTTVPSGYSSRKRRTHTSIIAVRSTDSGSDRPRNLVKS